MIEEHAQFSLTLGDESMALMWMLPLPQAEIDLKLEQGTDALLALMDAVELLWIFEASQRPALIMK